MFCKQQPLISFALDLVNIKPDDKRGGCMASSKAKKKKGKGRALSDKPHKAP